MEVWAVEVDDAMSVEHVTADGVEAAQVLSAYCCGHAGGEHGLVASFAFSATAFERKTASALRGGPAPAASPLLTRFF